MKCFILNRLRLPMLITILLFTSSLANAQRVEFTPYYGYMFAGKMTFYEGDLNIRNNPNYGISIDFEVDRRAGVFVELLYDRIDTRVDFIQYPTNVTNTLFDLSEEYYQVGGLYNKEINKKVSTFGVFTIGATRFHPKDSNYGDDWRFSATFGGGVKYFFSKTIGIRLQGRLKIPFYFSGGGVWVGPAGTYTYGGGTAILQADLTAGLIIRTGK